MHFKQFSLQEHTQTTPAHTPIKKAFRVKNIDIKTCSVHLTIGIKLLF